MRRPTLATLALSLLALLFGWETREALQETPGGQDNAATATAGVWQPGIPTPDPAPSADPAPMAATVAARPLFRPDRQPFREQVGSPIPVRNYEAEMSRFSLLGVLGLGDAPVGVVTRKTGNKTDRWELKEGDALPGFLVKEVRMDGLLLAADGREFLLPLYAGAPTAAPGALRTEVPRRDAAIPPPAPRAAAPAPAPGAALPEPAPPPASPLSPRGGRFPSTPMAPGASPAPLPANTSPVFTPRYIPGRR